MTGTPEQAKCFHFWYRRNLFQIYIERSIFQTFWKPDFGARFLCIALDASFWLLAYFLILLNCAKLEKDWTTLILYILQGSPFEFLVNYKNKKHHVKCVVIYDPTANIRRIRLFCDVTAVLKECCQTRCFKI